MQWVLSGLTTGYSMTAVADGLVGARAVAVAEEDLARLALGQGVKSKRVTAAELSLASRWMGCKETQCCRGPRRRCPANTAAPWSSALAEFGGAARPQVEDAWIMEVPVEWSANMRTR